MKMDKKAKKKQNKKQKKQKKTKQNKKKTKKKKTKQKNNNITTVYILISAASCFFLCGSFRKTNKYVTVLKAVHCIIISTVYAPENHSTL